MTIPRSVAEVLSSHVVLETEGIDRMYLNVYVPQLQRELGVVWYLRGHLGYPFASSAKLAPISEAFVAAVERFVKVPSPRPAAEMERLQARLRAQELDNVRACPSVPRLEVPDYLRASHVCLVLSLDLPVLAAGRRSSSTATVGLGS